MKNRTVILIITVGLIIGGIFSINWLIKEDKRDNTQYEEQISTNETTNEIVKANTTTTKKTTKKIVKTTKKTTTKKITNKVTQKTTKKVSTNSNNKTNGYRLTHYGWDCKGCGGNTAIGYNVKKTIYYNDKDYGKVRIVAMCSKIPLYSVIKIKNYKFGGDIIAIVIDRGVGCGTIDLLTTSEKKSSQLGIQNNVKIEILRRGK